MSPFQRSGILRPGALIVGRAPRQVWVSSSVRRMAAPRGRAAVFTLVI